MTTSNLELQLWLARCLPEKIHCFGMNNSGEFAWTLPLEETHYKIRYVRDTEWLHVCWLVEQGLDEAARMPWLKFNVELWGIVCPENKPDGLTEIAYGSPLHIWRATHATWQQRAAALKAVKGKD